MCAMQFSGGDACRGNTRYTSRTRWLRPMRPMILYWRRYGKAGGCQIKFKIVYILNGGVAQLGEHLPCKQGVKSSNLSISIRQKIKLFFDTEVPQELLAIRVLLHEYSLAEVAQQRSYVASHGSCAATSNANHMVICYCTLKTSYREMIRKIFYQDIREYTTIELLTFNCTQNKQA